MSTIAIVGAGMMGTALCWPLCDNNHTVRLIGTHLDEEIIASIRDNGVHPKLNRKIPEGVQSFTHKEIDLALKGTDLVVSGVSSFGVQWFADVVGPYLKINMPVIAVTKGLMDKPNGDLQIFPELINDRLSNHLQGQVSLNAIGGPCIAHELAARRQTSVVFCGPSMEILENLRNTFTNSYYHIQLSTDVLGVEVCAALKNAYAFGICVAMGMMERVGSDGLAQMYNPQAVLFAQSCAEMQYLLKIIGGNSKSVVWLPGSGDLFVTVFGGRTARLGRLVGKGHPFIEAERKMQGETLESVAIIKSVGRALPKLEARQIIQSGEFPLMEHLFGIVNRGERVDFPWDKFFKSWQN